MHQRIENHQGRARESLRMALIEKRHEILSILGSESIRHEQLRRVEEALERLDTSEVARCESCGQTIAFPRLQALSYQDQHLTVDLRDGGAVYLDTQLVRLTRKEFELLCLLAENAGEIVPRHTLLMKVWGYGMEIQTRTLDVHIRRLREKLRPYGDCYIETIFRIGYRFQRFREPHGVTSTLPEFITARA